MPDDNITTVDKLRCAERELRLRYTVFDRLVVEGKMTSQKAAREIKLMEEICADYRAQIEAERLL